MAKYIDARGKACPMPVILVKKEIDNGERDITITVDNEIAVENLKRLAADSGIEVKAEKNGNDFNVTFAGGAAEVKKEEPAVNDCTPNGCGYAVFFGKDHVGEGEYELGSNLAKMMLYTYSQSDDVPTTLIFMNSGVKLPTSDNDDIITSIKVLTEKGTEVIVCGTCLNYYGLTEKLKVGTVSNMYEIVEKMKKAAKVITV